MDIDYEWIEESSVGVIFLHSVPRKPLRKNTVNYLERKMAKLHTEVAKRNGHRIYNFLDNKVPSIKFSSLKL